MKVITLFAIATPLFFTAKAQETTPQEVLKEITYDDFKVNFKSALPVGEIGNLKNAEITVGENQVYLNGTDTSRLMASYGNLPTTYNGSLVELNEYYNIVFEFENIGYVKDDEELDADKILKALKEADTAANEARKAQGLSTLHTVGWEIPPYYNQDTNNLEFALRFRDETGETFVNHTVKILGRKGSMNVVLICDSEDLSSLRPMLEKSLASFQYTSGNKYSEYQEGDKIAEYGLTGLIAGGALFAAAKWGGKLWKLIIVGAIAVFAFFAKIKNKIFG